MEVSFVNCEKYNDPWNIIIGPKSDHCLVLSVTQSVSPSLMFLTWLDFFVVDVGTKQKPCCWFRNEKTLIKHEKPLPLAELRGSKIKATGQAALWVGHHWWWWLGAAQCASAWCDDWLQINDHLERKLPLGKCRQGTDSDYLPPCCISSPRIHNASLTLCILFFLLYYVLRPDSWTSELFTQPQHSWSGPWKKVSLDIKWEPH